MEVVEYFEYGKNNDRYWKKEHLLKQVIKKTLFIIGILYLGYQLLFLFNNATNYFIFASDVLQVNEMNKKIGSQ